MGKVRMLLAAGAGALLAACSQDPAAGSNQVTQNTIATSTGEQIQGWRYTVEADRIRGGVLRLATLLNDEDDPALDASVELGIQSLREGSIDVFLRGDSLNALRCSSPCSIAFRSDHASGMWIGMLGSDGVIVLDQPSEALRTIQSSSSLIVELDGMSSRQVTFHVRGLQWPPTSSSTPAPGR